jgi:cell division protein FtsQ
MWDNHQTLGLLANALFTVAALVAGYYIGKWAINLPLLPLKEVRVSATGASTLRHVTREQISDTVSSRVIGNFLTVDLDAVRRAFEKLPWVRVASVRRAWPDSLELKIEEQVALARWGSGALLNVQGEIFDGVSEELLPLFEGMDGSAGDMARQYRIFSELLRPVDQSIEYMKLSPRQAWTVRLENGTRLELGRGQHEARLKRFVSAYSAPGLPDTQLDYVDLRYPNGFAAR